MASAKEDPFELIQRGNAFEAASDHWRSAEFYSRASLCLRRRADDLSAKIRNEEADATKWKVVSLFRAQSLEYMFKSRHCLIEALRFENEQDRSRTLEVAKTGTGSLDPLCSLIAREEREKREWTFRMIFSGGGEAIEDESTVTDDAPTEPIEGSEQIEVVLEKNGTSKGSNSVFSDKQIEVLFEEKGTSKGSDSQSQAAPAAASSDTDSSKINQGEPAADPFPVVPSTAKDSNSQSQAAAAAASSDTDSSKINQGEPAAAPPPVSDGIDDRRKSIESRLADLDSSLLPNVPPPFVSGSRGNGGGDDKHRLEEIRKGLKGLGVTLPDSTKNSDLIPENLSAEDQVKLIIQQAKDEVRVEGGLHAGDGIDPNLLAGATEDDDFIDENDSMFEGFEDDDYDIDALLAKADNLVKKAGIEADGEGNFPSEVVQIKKVQALLLEARLCLEMEHAATSDEQIPVESPEETKDDNQKEEDEDGSDTVSNDSGEDHRDGAKLAARKKAKELVENAHDCMKKILKDWKSV